jgi:hypothetical protein
MLDKLSSRKILSLQLCNLGIKLKENKIICNNIKKLTTELEKKGLKHFNPKYYIGDEWFSPSESISISIPFFLCHPKLRKLEKQKVGFVEGDSSKWFMQLLRHETGHCIDYAYQLSKSQEWKKKFGNPNKKYSVDTYPFDITSKDFVINLEDHYAQSHPEEDFAETFAVWLQYDKATWKSIYKTWPKALSKLNYIDKKCNEIKNLAPIYTTTSQLANINRLRITLKTYYNTKSKHTTQ